MRHIVLYDSTTSKMYQEAYTQNQLPRTFLLLSSPNCFKISFRSFILTKEQSTPRWFIASSLRYRVSSEGMVLICVMKIILTKTKNNCFDVIYYFHILIFGFLKKLVA